MDNNQSNFKINENSPHHQKNKNGVGAQAIILIVIIASLIGGGIGGLLVHFFNDQNMPTQTSTNNSNQPTKVSNIVVKENWKGF